MKNLTFIACLCLATAAYAGNDKLSVSEITPNQLKLEKRIQGVNIRATKMENPLPICKKEVKTKDTQIKPSHKPAFLYKSILNAKELREMAAYTLKEQCDSMIGTWHISGENYGKMTFEFYENTHLPKHHVLSFWNPETKQWVPEEDHYYEWDKDGYCTLQQLILPQAQLGERREYTYNDQKLGDSQTISKYDIGISEDWLLSEKGVYEYNDQEDIIQETASLWNGTTWVPFVRNKAAWDSNHRQTNFEPYKWNGNNWVGDGEKSTHEYDPNGNVIVEGIYLWDEKINGWFNYFKMEQDFLNHDTDHLLRSAWQYWNKTSNDWSGGEEYYGSIYRNQLFMLKYDQQGRNIYSDFSLAFIPGTYTLGACRNLTWTNIEGGLVQCADTSTVYASFEEVLDEPFINDVVISHYDTTGNEIYFLERHINMDLGILVDSEIREKKYENGDLVREYQYISESNQAICITYTYDDNHNLMEQTARIKEEEGNNEENWTNKSHYEFTWDIQHGLLTKQLVYFWDGVNWAPSWGGEDIYDFNANLSEINMWLGADFLYKILETRSYSNNDGDWDYLSSKYYYSDIKTDVEKLIINANIKVYPTCVENQLNVESNENVKVNIYNIQGVLILTTIDKVINVSDLSQGIYLVEVNGYKTKIIKK